MLKKLILKPWVVAEPKTLLNLNDRRASFPSLDGFATTKSFSPMSSTIDCLSFLPERNGLIRQNTLIFPVSEKICVNS